MREIEPGMGIMSHQYNHHGAIAAVEMYLVRGKK